jgi:DNA (cytosine-5)-methyltransferase 1
LREVRRRWPAWFAGIDPFCSALLAHHYPDVPTIGALMRYLSLFSGIEAATVSWSCLGWECAAVSEIDPFCCALLKHYYPDVPNLGDVTKISRSRIEDLGPIDLVVFGSPCQDLSVAGKRAGIEGERSGLFFAAMHVVRWSGVRFALWENVPGAFSSNGGRDFAAVVREMVGVEPDVPDGRWSNSGVALGPDGLLEWCVLDAQFFGVPQRRRRIFALRDSGNWADRPPILLEPESLRGNPPARRKAREKAAGTIGGGAGERGRCNDLDRSGAFVSMSLNAKGGSGRMDGESETFVASGCVYWNESESAETLGTQGRALYESTAIVGPLVPTAFSAKDYGADAGPLAPTLRAMPHDRSHANAGGQVAVCFESRVARNGRGGPSEIVPPLKAQSGGTGRGDGAPLLAANGLAVRRLTPRECERLMGLPDDYTLIPHRGKLAADGPRYRVIGNSMAAPVMRWIGRRIQMVDSFRG